MGKIEQEIIHYLPHLLIIIIIKNGFSSLQSLSQVWLFVTP